MESNRDFLGVIGCILRGRRQHEEVRRRSDSGLLEHAALMGDVPDVTIARVNLIACRGNRNLMSFRVGDRVLTAPDIPFTPGCYDGQIGSECSVSELEADLIVTLSSATMGERIRSHLTSDLNLPARNEGTAHRGAEEVLSTINCSGSEGGPDEILDKFPPEILDVALVGPGSNSFGPHTLQLLALAVLIASSFWIVRPFLVASTWAIMIVVATWPLLLHAQAWLGGRRYLAVALMTIALLLILVIPLYLGIRYHRGERQPDRGLV